MRTPLQFFVGTYTKPILFGTGKILYGKGEGIYFFEIDLDTRKIIRKEIAAHVDNPSYLIISPNGHHLFCVNELKDDSKRSGGKVSSFKLQHNTLKYLNTEPTHGADPCHVALDSEGKFLFTVNFMSGSFCMHPITNDGYIGSMADFRQHEGHSLNPVRQNSPHAHASTLSADNRFVFIPDLGLDKVCVYELDYTNWKLIDRNDLSVSVTPGAGPRHIVFHPTNRWAYLINELNSTITTFAYDLETGKLSFLEKISTLPKDFTGESTCAHIQISPCGEFVYGSNRGHDSLAAFKINRDGTLKTIGFFSTKGKSPRHFTIEPTGNFVIVANQDSDRIVLLKRNILTGELVDYNLEIDIPTPVCVEVLNTSQSF